MQVMKKIYQYLLLHAYNFTKIELNIIIELLKM